MSDTPIMETQAGDAGAFAANLRKVLSEPRLADRMGRAAQEHIAANHTLASGAKRLESLLLRALRNHSSRQEAKRN